MKEKDSNSKKYLKQISKAKRIAIIAHTNPDADAIGSSLALKRLIKQNLETEEKKYQIDVFFDTEEFDDKYKPLIGNQRINEQRFRKYDLAIALDSSSRERLGKYDKIFQKASDTLNIDHHETNTKFAKNNIVASRCSSTCELLHILLIKAENWKCTSDIYSLLYAGIITDTNNLTQNIGVNTLSTITDITYRGLADHVNLEQIRDHFFKSNTPEQISLLTRALDSINFYQNGQIAVMKINKTDFAETNTSQDDTLGIVDYATRLQGVKIGVLFIKQEDNSYYVSLRSKEDIDVGSIAKKMNGGGHRNIAAFTMSAKDSLTDIKSDLFDYCKQELKKNKKEVEIGDLFVEVSGTGQVDSDDESQKDEKNCLISEELHEEAKAKDKSYSSIWEPIFKLFHKSNKPNDEKKSKEINDASKDIKSKDMNNSIKDSKSKDTNNSIKDSKQKDNLKEVKNKEMQEFQDTTKEVKIKNIDKKDAENKDKLADKEENVKNENVIEKM